MLAYILLYLAIGVVIAVAAVIFDAPYDVTLGNLIFGLPTFMIGWPVVLVFMLLDSHVLARHLFTIRGRHDKED